MISIPVNKVELASPYTQKIDIKIARCKIGRDPIKSDAPEQTRKSAEKPLQILKTTLLPNTAKKSQAKSNKKSDNHIANSQALIYA